MEIFTLVTGVIYVVLEIRQKNFMWIVGMANALAAMYMFFSKDLYASFGLNTYYFAIAFWGLYQWRRDARRLKAGLRVSGKRARFPATGYKQGRWRDVLWPSALDWPFCVLRLPDWAILCPVLTPEWLCSVRWRRICSAVRIASNGCFGLLRTFCLLCSVCLRECIG